MIKEIKPAPDTVQELHALAVAGDAESQCELGDLYNRRAMPMNFYLGGLLELCDERAEYWYNLSACQGNMDAFEQLKDMRHEIGVMR